MKEKVHNIEDMEIAHSSCPIEEIRELLPQDELTIQLAEEACELALAALKMRRTMSNVNPTPVTRKQAEDNLLEEIADVKLCLHATGFESVQRKIAVNRIISQKTARWIKRLKGRE